MTAQPITLKVIRDAEATELSELSALALIWGLAKAITETPSDALDLFLDELPGDMQPDRRA